MALPVRSIRCSWILWHYLHWKRTTVCGVLSSRFLDMQIQCEWCHIVSRWNEKENVEMIDRWHSRSPLGNCTHIYIGRVSFILRYSRTVCFICFWSAIVYKVTLFSVFVFSFVPKRVKKKLHKFGFHTGCLWLNRVAEVLNRLFLPHSSKLFINLWKNWFYFW